MKLATEEQMEFNISIGEHPHRTYSRLYWTRIMMPTQVIEKEERTVKRTVSVKYHWHMGANKFQVMKYIDGDDWRDWDKDE